MHGQIISNRPQINLDDLRGGKGKMWLRVGRRAAYFSDNRPTHFRVITLGQLCPPQLFSKATPRGPGAVIRLTKCSEELLGRYRSILEEQRLSWTEHHRFMKLLGYGGQGVVYLTERRGTDDFTLPVALKIFSPERYEDEKSYDEAMGRMAQVAGRVAQIQQDNLLDVHNWVERDRIRMMEMEWVDGFDLSRLLTRKRCSIAFTPE